MTAPPSGALEACLALLEKATAGEWMLATSCSWRRVVSTGHANVLTPTVHSDGHPDLSCGPDYVNAEAAIAAVNLLRTHGPALLAALRLREWRPIESAPEDTPIWLVDAENTMWVGVHVYVENEGYAWTNCYRDFDYHNGKWQTSTADWDDDYQPIGWQPLPEPRTADDLARVLEEGE